MAGVAQLVRASDCGSEGRGFETLHSPQNKNVQCETGRFSFEVIAILGNDPLEQITNSIANDGCRHPEP